MLRSSTALCSEQFSTVKKGDVSYTFLINELCLFFAIVHISGHIVMVRTTVYWKTAKDVHH